MLFRKGGALFDCAAIDLLLCDRHPEANLAPGLDDRERILKLQRLIYFSSPIQSAF